MVGTVAALRSGGMLTPRRRLFPYQITVGALSLVFLMVMMWLISAKQLLPGIVLVGSFMLFVLWLTGLVELGILLFGAGNSVNANCNAYISNRPFTGVSVGTLAWIAEKNICEYSRTLCRTYTELVRQLLGCWLCVSVYRRVLLDMDDGHGLPSTF